MKMFWKSVMIFAGGLLIGATSGYQFAKKKYVAIKEQQIEELKAAGEIREEYLLGPEARDKEFDEESGESRENGILSSEARSTMKHLRKKTDQNGRVPYHKYYETVKEDVDPAEKESPEEISEAHLEHIDDPPELIDSEGLGDVPEWVESETLFYFVEENRLTDEDEQDVMDPEYHVGDILEKMDWDNVSDNIIFIWNHSFDTLYEVNLL